MDLPKNHHLFDNRNCGCMCSKIFSRLHCHFLRESLLHHTFLQKYIW
ncbi:hypothetical protein DC888_22515 [Vibrio parahaemolyticus]|nr:hypothetical protein [Vibrio parahaemolyticus]